MLTCLHKTGPDLNTTEFNNRFAAVSVMQITPVSATDPADEFAAEKNILSKIQ